MKRNDVFIRNLPKEMGLGMKRFFRENMELLRHGRNFFQFELLYKLIGAAAVTPALLVLFRLSIRAAGLSYLTNDNLGIYLHNPLAALGTAAILFVLAYFILVEMAAMSLYFHLKRFGKSPRPMQLFASSLRCAGRVFRPRNLLMVPFLVLVIPLTNFALVSGYLTTIRIPDFIVQYIAHRRILFWGCLGFLTIFFFLAVRWIFSIHYFVLERKPFRESCRASSQLIRGRYLPTLGRILFWEAAAHGGLLLLYLLFLGTAFLVSRIFVPGSMGMTAFLEAFHWINILLLIVGSCLTIPIAFTAVSSEFYRLKELKRERSPRPRELGIPPRTAHLHRNWGIGVTMLLLVSVMSVSYILPEIEGGRFGTLEALQQPRITAHRGNSVRAPENTMAAFQAAVDAQADCIELDVQQLADGTIIILHDSNFRRTAGVDQNVWEAVWEEVQCYDVGSWFSAEFAGERIPTLEEAVQFADGKAFLNIELKSTGRERNLEEEVIRIVRENHFESQCVITSQQYSVLRRVKELAPELQTGYVLSVAYGRFYDMEDVDLFSVRSDFITTAMVRELHNRGKRIYAWTVNDSDRLEKLNEMRVDDLITDDPKTARAVVSAENTGETFLGIFEKLFSESSFSTAAKTFWKAAFGK
ncbi:MAG: glycerophosphodiester phosphodiesterase family protein [Candidatus Merdivicinus sp.]|jgi:glycerophosphoryl diester phosphodiesterase